VALDALQTAVDAFNGLENEAAEHDPYLFNYPLHYEVIQQGIYYHDPTIPSNQPTYHYAVLPPNFSLPSGVTVDVLADLVHFPYNSYVVAEAFRRVDAVYYDVDGQVLIDCTPSCPNYPQCYDPQVSCSDGTIRPLPVPCEPGSTWYQCGQIFIPPPQAPTNGGTNSCGCYVHAERNKPSGCVEVEDTQLGWEGVRNVKIYVKDLYLFGRGTWTNHSGCWNIDHRYFGGIHPFVDWYNTDIEVRALRGADIFQLTARLKQNCGTHGGGVYNDFQNRHGQNTDKSKIERAHWVGSTGLNAYYEYNNYALLEQVGRASSPRRLRLWILNNSSSSGAAPMLCDLADNVRCYFK
jgi:hypothetical protein